MSQLNWLAKWNTVHRPGYEWSKFQAQLFDERLRSARDIRVVLYPLNPDRSCVMFTDRMTGKTRARYKKQLVKKAIKFGLQVQIKTDTLEPRSGDH